MVASLWRGVAVGAAGVLAAILSPIKQYTVIFGLDLGLAAGMVSALVGSCGPVIEWWIGALPKEWLGVAGLVLIFTCTALQSLQYWIVVLDLPTH